MMSIQKHGLQLRRDGGVTRLPAPVRVSRARLVVTAAAAGPRNPGTPLQPNAPPPAPGVATKAASSDFGISAGVAIPAVPAPRAAPKDVPKIEARKLQEVVALGEPAFYAYRDAAICEGTLSVEMAHADTHTHDGAEGGKAGQQKEDDGTLVTFANTAFGHVLIEKNFRGRLRLEATILELPTGLATTVPPLLLEVGTSGDKLPRNYHTRTTSVLDNATTLDLLLADPEAVASGAATVQLSLRKHIRLGKTDPEEVVSLGEPVTLDLSSSEPQQLLVGGLTLSVRASLATFDGKPGYDGADSADEHGNAWAPDPLPGTWPDLHTWYRRWSAASKGVENLDAAFGAESLRLRSLTGQAAPLYEPVAFISYVCHSRWGVDSQAWVMINPTLKHVVLAFRGTTSAADWAADINAMRINPYGTKGVEVHRGFHTALQVVAEDLYKSVDSLIEASGDPEGWRVVCTGHSLGGALATLAAYELMRKEVPGRRVWLTTFGSPRVGNKAFAADFMERQRKQGEVHAYRVANDADPVPKTPVGWNGNYWHVGTPVVLEASGGKVEPDNTDSGLGAQLWDLFSGMTGMVTTDLMKQQVAVMHSWPEYLKNLRVMVDQVAGRKGGATVA